jgi:hypothetical protein
MVRRKYNKKGNGIIDSIKNGYWKIKWKLSNVNDYLKQKQFAKNLITNDIGWHNPVRAISQAYGVNKILQNSMLNAPLQFLAAHGYGRRKKRRTK